jgi:pSer/pThr/pTyr-binding forkhead associated (FHA) protein
VINDSSVSRIHAQLHVNRDGGFSLTDLDSLNGTFVNDRKIKGTQNVKAGDTVAFGTIKANIFKA